MFVNKTHKVFYLLKHPQGNKGGVAISCWMYGRKFCFLNTHLIPHRQNSRQRVEQFKYILEKMMFGNYQKVMSHESVATYYKCCIVLLSVLSWTMIVLKFYVDTRRKNFKICKRYTSLKINYIFFWYFLVFKIKSF